MTSPSPERITQLGLSYNSGNGQLAYHVSFVKHRVGSRINHGSSQHEAFFLPLEALPADIRTDTVFMGYRKLEAIFEAVRSVIAPSAPSRRQAAFAFLTEDIAVGFRDRSRAGADVYVVNIEPMTPCFVGDMAWRNIAASIIKGKTGRGRTPSVEEIATEYWRATRFNGGNSTPEVIVGGALTVVQRVDA